MVEAPVAYESSAKTMRAAGLWMVDGLLSA